MLQYFPQNWQKVHRFLHNVLSYLVWQYGRGNFVTVPQAFLVYAMLFLELWLYEHCCLDIEHWFISGWIGWIVTVSSRDLMVILDCTLHIMFGFWARTLIWQQGQRYGFESTSSASLSESVSWNRANSSCVRPKHSKCHHCKQNVHWNQCLLSLRPIVPRRHGHQSSESFGFDSLGLADLVVGWTRFSIRVSATAPTEAKPSDRAVVRGWHGISVYGE